MDKYLCQKAMEWAAQGRAFRHWSAVHLGAEDEWWTKQEADAMRWAYRMAAQHRAGR